MNRLTFMEAMTNKKILKPDHFTDEEIKQCHKSYIDYHIKNNSDEIYVIPIEEMAELTQHLSKLIRGKEAPNEIGVLEEIADVQICLDNLRMVLGIDDDTLKYAMDIKFERCNEKIKKGTA